VSPQISAAELERAIDRVQTLQRELVAEVQAAHPPDLILPGAIGGASMLALGVMLAYFSYRLGTVADAPIRRWFSTWAVVIGLAGVGLIVQAVDAPNPIRECGMWTFAASFCTLLVLYGAGLRASIDDLVARHKLVRDGGRMADAVQVATVRLERIVTPETAESAA